ncbi:unnamed protein product [Penicillium glandicola]
MDRDPAFNHGGYNEMPWPGPAGSLGSSEEFINGQGYGNYPPGPYSADMTSMTSFDAFQQQFSEFINADPIGQMREPPQKHESDLNGIDVRYDKEEKDIPQVLDIPQTSEDPRSSTTTQQPADDLRGESTARPSGGLNRVTLGIPDDTPFSPENSINHVLNELGTTCHAIVSHRPYRQSEVSRGRRHIETLRQILDAEIATHPVASIGSSERDGESYRCFRCDRRRKSAVFRTLGVYKRHLTTHGILEYNWRCTKTGCDVTLRRRDRMRDHLVHKHKMTDLLPDDVQQTREECPHPNKCPICNHATPSWAVYWDHIKRHCLISPRSGNASTDGDMSRRGDNNNGNDGNGHGHGHGHSRSFSLAGPSNSNGESQFNQSNNRTGSTLYPNASFGGDSMRNNMRPNPITHSVSDSHLNSSHHQIANDVVGEPMDDLPGSSRGPRAHLPRGANTHPNNPQPPQPPGWNRPDLSTKRARSNKQKEPADDKAPTPNKCSQCGHDMAQCPQCKPDRGCHGCLDMLGSSIQKVAPSAMPMQAVADEFPTNDYSNEPYANPQPSFGGFAVPHNVGTYQTLANPNMTYQNLEPHQNMHNQLPLDYNPNDGMQVYNPQSFGSMTNASFLNDRYAGMAIVTESHPCLSDLGDKVQVSHVDESDTKLLHSMGLDVLTGPLSVKTRKQPKAKASTGPASGSYTDLVFRNKSSPVILQHPQPATYCQCPCVKVPIKVSSNQRLEMTFKITPERESSHPLRTKVQVFVKLFRLRASAAKSNSKQQRTRSITLETTTDQDTESGPDSNQELSPILAADSELTPPLYWTEDVHELSFNLEIESILLELAQSSGGKNVSAFQKLLMLDPAQVLNLISTYFAKRFKVLLLFAVIGNKLGLLLDF